MSDDISENELPQLYLVTPPQLELSTYPGLLARCLDEVDVSCVRLELATRDEDAISRAADVVREVCHARDIAIVIADHVLMVERLGLDGVHFTDGSRQVRNARKDLGQDAIVGAFCGDSRHDGMTAGEVGADYVSFGPVGPSNLGHGTVAEAELFQWWSEMIEVPVVAEGGLSVDLVRQLTQITDFFCMGEELWTAEDPVAVLKTLAAARS